MSSRTVYILLSLCSLVVAVLSCSQPMKDENIRVQVFRCINEHLPEMVLEVFGECAREQNYNGWQALMTAACTEESEIDPMQDFGQCIVRLGKSNPMTPSQERKARAGMFAMKACAEAIVGASKKRK